MNKTEKPFLFDFTLPELTDLIKGWGEKQFRARQIWEWAYVKLASSFDEMSDLPKALRAKLIEEIEFTHLSSRIDLLSTDGWTRKILFDLPDMSQIETVLMGYDTRRTVCISTQAGCGLGCTFCATGQGGLQRHEYHFGVIPYLYTAGLLDFRSRCNVVIGSAGHRQTA